MPDFCTRGSSLSAEWTSNSLINEARLPESRARTVDSPLDAVHRTHNLRCAEHSIV